MTGKDFFTFVQFIFLYTPGEWESPIFLKITKTNK